MRPNNPLLKQFRAAKRLITDVGRGESVCCAISGAGGIGKTHLAKTTLDAMGVPNGIFSGSGAGLLNMCYEQRAGNYVILIDDADGLITGGGEKQANLMKAVLGTEVKGREIVNGTRAAYKNEAEGFPDPSIPPPRFVTRVGLVWITNKDMTNLDWLSVKMRSHITALITRGLHVVQLSLDPLDALEYVLHIAQQGGVINNVESMIRGTSKVHRETVSLKMQNESLEWFVTNAHRLKSIDFRTLRYAVRTHKSHPDDWEETLEEILSKVPLYDFPLPPIPVIGPTSLKRAA
jgi:hypothetical protein